MSSPLKAYRTVWTALTTSRQISCRRAFGQSFAPKIRPAHPIADLTTIKLALLRQKEASEAIKLLQACSNDGFFYLSLEDEQGRSMLQDWRKILVLMKDWFRRPLSEKMRYHLGTVLHGYTPVGTYAGVLDGTRDGNETIKITPAATQSDPPVLPDVYKENEMLFKRFMEGSRGISICILSCLSDALALRGEDRFEQSHRPDRPSNCSLNLFCYPRILDKVNHFGQNKHTDNGSLTLLFNDTPGLEILSPSTGLWGKVLPRPGHAVANVGDTLRFLSCQKLYSAIHRVMPKFGDQQQERMAVGYFLRAEDDKAFIDDHGKRMTAREWHDQKYGNYMASHAEQRSNTILTGGMEDVLKTPADLKNGSRH